MDGGKDAGEVKEDTEKWRGKTNITCGAYRKKHE